jgi:hypothetical protein
MVYKKFDFENNEYTLEFQEITLEIALKIDAQTYKEKEYLTINEITQFLKNVKYLILSDKEVIFDSIKHDFRSLNFNLIKIIYDKIKEEFCLDLTETQEFIHKCKLFLEADNIDVPLEPELFVAKNLFEKNLSLTYLEMMNMNCKKYEKIILALNILKNNSQESEK